MIVLTVVALALLVAGIWRDARHIAQTQELLGRQDAERFAWAKERYELNQRIQAPHLAPLIGAPTVSPDPTSAAEPADVDEDDEDESHLVGLDITTAVAA